MTVKVKDFGTPSLETNCFLFVKILDVNDNSPVFDYAPSFYSTYANLASLSQSTRIARVFAYDLDHGANGTVSYALSTVIPSCVNCFTVDSATGWILKGSSQLSAAVGFINFFLWSFTANIRCTLNIINPSVLVSEPSIP